MCTQQTNITKPNREDCLMTNFKKKVLAFALASSMILSSVSVAFAANTTPVDKLGKMVELTVIQGEGGEINPAQTLTRYRAVAMQIKLMGRFEEIGNYNVAGKQSFKDAPAGEGFVAKLMAFVKNTPELGIQGYPDGSFKPMEPITAKEYAHIMLLSLGYEYGKDYTWSQVASLAVALGIADHEAEVTNAHISVGQVADFTYDALALPAKNETAKTLGEKLGYPVVITTPVVEVKELAVAQVVASNLKSVRVVFNQEIDKDSVSDASIKVKDKTIEVSLADDKKTAVIVFNANLAQSEEIEITVNGVKAANGKELKDYTNKVTVNDTTIPALLAVNVINAQQIEILASEPINFTNSGYQVLNNIKVDGAAAIARVTADHVNNKVLMEFSTIKNAGTYSIEIADVSDFSGYKAPKSTFSFTIVEDKDAPVMTTAEAKNIREILVTFNESVKTPGSFKVNGTDMDATPVANSNGTQFLLSKAGFSLDLSAIVEVKVAYKGQKDFVGNEVKDEITFTFKVQDDITLPSVAHKLETGNKLTLTFSKSMLTDVGTIKVLDKDAKEVKSFNVSDLTFKADTNNTVIEMAGSALTLDNVDPAKYTINIKGMKDASVRRNDLVEQKLEINALDTKNPTVTNTYFVQNGSEVDKDTITFYFSEEMDKATVNNLSNYLKQGGVVLSAINKVAVKEIAANGKSVTITYPNARTLTGADKFTIYALKDVAGNMMDATADIGRLMETAISYVSASVYNKNEIVVEFNTDIQSVDPSAIKVLKNGEAYTIATMATIKDGRFVTFTLQKELDATNPSEYTVAANSTHIALIKNVYGEAFANTATIADGTVKDYIAPEIKSVTKGEGNTIVLTYSENITVTNATGLLYDLTVENLDDKVQLAPTSEFTIAHEDNKIIITLLRTTNNNDHKFAVTLRNGRYITDASGQGNKAGAFEQKVVKGADDKDATFNIAAE